MNQIRNLSLLALVILLNPSYSVAMQEKETDTDHYAKTDLTPNQQLMGQVEIAYSQLKNGISGPNNSNIKFLQTNSKILAQVVGQEQIDEDKKKYPLVPKIYEKITKPKTVPAASNTGASSSNRRKSISTTSLEIHTNNNNNNNDADNAISTTTTITRHSSDDANSYASNSSTSSNYYDALDEEPTTAISSSTQPLDIEFYFTARALDDQSITSAPASSSNQSSTASNNNNRARRKSVSGKKLTLTPRIIKDENGNYRLEEEKKKTNNNNNHVRFQQVTDENETKKASDSWRCPSPESSIDYSVGSRAQVEAADLRARNRNTAATAADLASASISLGNASSPLEMVAFAKHNRHASSSPAAPATSSRISSGSTSSGSSSSSSGSSNSGSSAKAGIPLGTKAAAGFNVGLLAVVLGVLANSK
jgi:hypothetical protein